MVNYDDDFRPVPEEGWLGKRAARGGRRDPYRGRQGWRDRDYDYGYAVNEDEDIAYGPTYTKYGAGYGDSSGGIQQQGWRDRDEDYGYAGEEWSEDFGSRARQGPRRASDGRRGPYSGVGPMGYRRPDERILEEAIARLTQHGRLDARSVEVHVEGGEITLSGTVDSRHAKRAAEDALETIRGVRDIHNRLRITQEA